MKKFFAITMVLAAGAFVVPSVEARTAATTTEVTADPQIRVQIGRDRRRGRGWNNRRARTRIYTRYTRIGRYRYRETVRVTYLPNGRVRSRVISRVRVGRR